MITSNMLGNVRNTLEFPYVSWRPLNNFVGYVFWSEKPYFNELYFN